MVEGKKAYATKNGTGLMNMHCLNLNEKKPCHGTFWYNHDNALRTTPNLLLALMATEAYVPKAAFPGLNFLVASVIIYATCINI